VNATKTRRLVRSTAVAMLLAVPTLSSCATTNFDAQTDQYYTPADGENAREGTVDVLHALIISEEPGQGRLIAGLSNPGTSGRAPVGAESGDSQDSQEYQTEAEGDDALTGVRGIDDSEGVQFSIVEGETEIPAGSMLQLANEGSAVVAVSGDPELVAPGKYVRLAFTFESGEEVEVNVPVLAPGVDYADIEIPPADSSASIESSDTEG
jgi:hypothetical protein